MKIIADDKIPFLRGVLESQGAKVIYLPGNAISAESVRTADALVIRTRTRCSEALLGGSSVRLIATATIGFDHIDTAWCEASGIRWVNAPGCNSSSVAQYVASVVMRDLLKNGIDPHGKKFGVIGAGNVGTKVAALARILGMEVLLNDPPKQREALSAEAAAAYFPLKTLCEECDYLSLHTPLNKAGRDRTFHLADGNFFRACRKTPFFINTSRGENADGKALIRALNAGLVRGAAIDVWENEPNIDIELLRRTDCATPHIAGYSADGKANGTAAAVRALAEFFHLPALGKFYPPEVPPPENPVIRAGDHPLERLFPEAVLHAYDVLRDDAPFRAAPESLEFLRGHYPLRREFSAYTVSAGKGKWLPPELAAQLSAFGFRLSCS